MFQGVPFLSIGVVGAVTPLNTPSGLDRGETSVIICFSRCLWVQGSEGCSLWCWGWGSTDQIISGGHCCCHSPLCYCSCFSLQPGLPHHAASPPDSLAYEPIFSTPCSLHLSKESCVSKQTCLLQDVSLAQSSSCQPLHNYCIFLSIILLPSG